MWAVPDDPPLMDSLLHPPPHPTPMQKHAGRLEAAERWEALGSQLRMTFCALWASRNDSGISEMHVVLGTEGPPQLGDE